MRIALAFALMLAAAQAQACDRFRMVAWPGGTPGFDLTAADFQGGQVLATEADVVDAQVSADQNGQPAVLFTLGQDGKELFAAHTGTHMGEPIGIIVDQKLITAPIIMSAIWGGQGMINGLNTRQEAIDTAAILNNKDCAGEPSS